MKVLVSLAPLLPLPLPHLQQELLLALELLVADQDQELGLNLAQALHTPPVSSA
jgi:hypothetical protein